MGMAKPMRKVRLNQQLNGQGGNISVLYAQYITLCGQENRVDVAVEVWLEWTQSTMGVGGALGSETLWGAVMTTFSAFEETNSIALSLLEDMLETIVCATATDSRAVGAALKCASHVHRFVLAERVWEWAKPMREHRLLGCGGQRGDLPLICTQYVTLCGQEGHSDHVVNVWREWSDSRLGSCEEGTHDTAVLRRTAMTTLSTRPETHSIACDMLEDMVKTQICVLSTWDVGTGLKIASNVHRFDLAQRVWEWQNQCENINSSWGTVKTTASRSFTLSM